MRELLETRRKSEGIKDVELYERYFVYSIFNCTKIRITETKFNIKTSLRMHFQLGKSVWNVPKDAAKQRPILSFSVMTESRAYGRREEQSKAWPESSAVLHIFEAMCFCSLLPEFPNSVQKY